MLPSQTGPCQTSSRSLVFGLGPSITSEDGIITGAKLPTGRQIIRCMLAKKPGANGALSQFEATKGVLEQVRPFYKKANIAMMSDKRTCHKMVDLVNANNKLRKISQAKRSILAFLASMKTDRVATFGVLDKKLQLKVKRREERQAAAAARQSRCEKELEEMTAMSSLVSESDEEPEEDTNTVPVTRDSNPDGPIENENVDMRNAEPSNKPDIYCTESSVPYTWGLKQITWNYSERAHGKGAPDGVGGAVKRMADNHVHGGKALQNPKDLYEFLINREVENIRFKWIDEKIYYRDLSCFCQYPEMCECFKPTKMRMDDSSNANSDHLQPDSIQETYAESPSTDVEKNEEYT
ncbi:hypothetical protein KUCAC02_001822, partial [Chaenocephalus aceratus]